MPEEVTWVSIAAAMNEHYGYFGKKQPYTGPNCRDRYKHVLDKIDTDKSEIVNDGRDWSAWDSILRKLGNIEEVLGTTASWGGGGGVIFCGGRGGFPTPRALVWT